ncbi:hypothetical protein KVP09_04450 [Alcaligenaceae bacterium CGII-47]|nr:hypothetical protein [Alcaligenaceae bacterium CGII-47]
MELSLRRAKVVRIENAFLKNDKGRLVVWWYGPMVKNRADESVPLVEVFFRRLIAGGNEPAGWIRQKIALTQLGLLRIGSVWKKGVCNEYVTYPKAEFKMLDFSEDGWSFTSLAKIITREGSSLFSLEGYPLQHSKDRNALLDFHHPDGKRLLVPSIEYFSRCYGRSAESRRVLATYPWYEARGRLLRPIEESAEPGTWPVNLGKRMHKDDAVFLAHVQYCDYTRSVAKDIYAQTEVAFKAPDGAESYAFLEAKPWFSGPAQLSAEGVWLDADQTFLALRIVGESQPNGKTVIRNREISDGLGRQEGAGDLESNYPVRQLRRLPEIIDLTSNEAPDHGASAIDIEADEMEILGDPREVIDRKRAVERGLVKHVRSDQEIRVVSTGEPFGSGKGVGFGSIHSPVVLESQGVLRDMWNALCKLQERLPDIVQSVGWFTFEDGVSHDPEFKLISLEPFGPDDTEVSNEVRRWVYYDRKAKIPRGVLVIVIQAGETSVCLVEMQRRPVLKKCKDGEVEPGEQPLGALVFALRRQDDLGVLIRDLLEQIRRKTGVALRVSNALGWEQSVFAFKHVPANGEAHPCEVTVRSALKKVGVIT